MNLYFQRANGDHLLIKTDLKNVDAGFKECVAFLKRHRYTAEYIRYWTEDGITTYDVGSWSEFLILAPEGTIKHVGTESNFIDREDYRKC